MSNTKRRDHYVEVSGTPLFNEDRPWKVVGDRKKWYKPSKKQKNGYIGKIRVARRQDMKKAMMHPDEDGEVVLPKEKKTDVWFYN